MVSILGGNLQINFFSNLVEKNSLIVKKFSRAVSRKWHRPFTKWKTASET